MQEIWIPVVGFEDFYEVSNTGLVRTLPRFARIRGGGLRPIKARVLKPFVAGGGYHGVSLAAQGECSKHYVHRLVATAFVKNPLCLPEVNHIDSVRQNNVHSNLEWVSRQENEDHKVRSGRTLRGEDSPRSKLTHAEVDQIKCALAGGETQASIAKRYGIAQATVCRINIGASWVPHPI